MTPEADHVWRVILVAGIVAVVGVFREQIMAFLYKIGYRDWRNPPK
jgi:hypothetical protein